MPVGIKKKEGETPTSLVYRFTKRIQQSGVLKEAKKRRFKSRNINKGKRRKSTLYKQVKKREVEKKRKLGQM